MGRTVVVGRILGVPAAGNVATNVDVGTTVGVGTGVEVPIRGDKHPVRTSEVNKTLAQILVKLCMFSVELVEAG